MTAAAKLSGVFGVFAVALACSRPEPSQAREPQAPPSTRVRGPAVRAPAPVGLARLVPVTVSASSTRSSSKGTAPEPWRVFDAVEWPQGGLVESSWCNSNDASGHSESLTIRFAQPTEVGKISIRVQTAGDREDDFFRPIGEFIEVRLDDTSPLPVRHDDDGWHGDPQGRLASTIKVTVLADGQGQRQSDVCVNEVRFERISAVPVAGFWPLPDLSQAVAMAQKSFEACDPSLLASVRYPLSLMDQMYDEDGNVEFGKKIATSKKLRSFCERMPKVVGTWVKADAYIPFPGDSLGEVRVFAGKLGEQWFMWTFDMHAGLWRLRGIELLANMTDELPGSP